MLRATTACTFSSLIWPACSAAAALASFSTLRSHKSLEKHSESRRSYLFAHLHLLSSDPFSSHLLSSDLFSSDSSHLCFSTVHIVGSFTSKLPSMVFIYLYIYIHELLVGSPRRMDDSPCVSLVYLSVKSVPVKISTGCIKFISCYLFVLTLPNFPWSHEIGIPA